MLKLQSFDVSVLINIGTHTTLYLFFMFWVHTITHNTNFYTSLNPVKSSKLYLINVNEKNIEIG